MKPYRLIGTLCAFAGTIFLWAGATMAEDRATPEEAQAMAEAAAAYYQDHGADAAFEAFNTSPDFHDRDLYVFAFDKEGNVAAHGANQNLVGRNVIDLRDPSGLQFIREMIAVEDTGWVEHQWQHPESGAVEDKASYIINVGDYIIGVGAYR